MLKVRVNKKSGHFLELISSLDIPQKNKKYSYGVETYILTPKRLRIIERNYSKEDFYKSFKNNTRLHVALLPFEEILKDDGDFLHIENEINLFLAKEKEEYLNKLEEDLKILCMHIKHAMQSYEKTIKSIIKKKLDPTKQLKEIIKNCQKTFKKLEHIKKLSSKSNSKLPDIVRFCENYIYLTIKYYVDKIIDNILTKTSYELDSEIFDFKRETEEYITEELKTPKLSNNSNNKNELFFRRYKYLQRYVQSILYLNKRVKKDIFLSKHMVFSIAAAVSMLLATGITYIWQYKYGALSTPLFVALVLGYILKDRVKDWIKEFGYDLLLQYFWDHHRNLVKNNKNVVGSYTESFYHVNNQEKLSEDIKEAIKPNSGENDILLEFLPKKNIMCYHKNIKIKKDSSILIGKNDKITMFNINLFSLKPFLDRVGDSNKSWFFYDKEKQNINKVKTVRTLDIVLVCKYKMNGKKVLLKKFIIKISKDKIHSIKVAK